MATGRKIPQAKGHKISPKDISAKAGAEKLGQMMNRKVTKARPVASHKNKCK